MLDNAQGTPNYSAPGAHRYKIELILTKRNLNTFDIMTSHISTTVADFNQLSRNLYTTEYLNIIPIGDTILRPVKPASTPVKPTTSAAAKPAYNPSVAHLSSMFSNVNVSKGQSVKKVESDDERFARELQEEEDRCFVMFAQDSMLARQVQDQNDLNACIVANDHELALRLNAEFNGYY